jgi:hypothetical protein
MSIPAISNGSVTKVPIESFLLAFSTGPCMSTLTFQSRSQLILSTPTLLEDFITGASEAYIDMTELVENVVAVEGIRRILRKFVL